MPSLAFNIYLEHGLRWLFDDSGAQAHGCESNHESEVWWSFEVDVADEMMLAILQMEIGASLLVYESAVDRRGICDVCDTIHNLISLSTL